MDTKKEQKREQTGMGQTDSVPQTVPASRIGSIYPLMLYSSALKYRDSIVQEVMSPIEVLR